MESSQAKEGTADGTINAGPCYLTFITGYATSDDVEITLHDNASAASGTVVQRMKLDFSVKPTDHHPLPHPIACRNGLYLTITGTTPKVLVGIGLE